MTEFKKMQVSVVIPVYNAEKYLVKAVESALSQKYVHELILVEDNSPDKCLELCRRLERSNSKVKVIRHPGGENLGAAESRNLGIRSANCEYIAFLDADDYYLPERFEVANELFEKNDSIDGVYEAIGMHYYSEDARQKWMTQSGEQLTTVCNGIDPDELFEKLLIGENGYLHLDGLVVKKSIFDQSGYFPTQLRLHQDTAIIIKLASVGKLVPGRLNIPVANRGIHEENRITSNYNERITRNMLWKSLFYWSIEKNLISSRKAILFKRYTYSILRLIRRADGFVNRLKYVGSILYECSIHPILTAKILLSLIALR